MVHLRYRPIVCPYRRCSGRTSSASQCAQRCGHLHICMYIHVHAYTVCHVFCFLLTPSHNGYMIPPHDHTCMARTDALFLLPLHHRNSLEALEEQLHSKQASAAAAEVRHTEEITRLQAQHWAALGSLESQHRAAYERLQTECSELCEGKQAMAERCYSIVYHIILCHNVLYCIIMYKITLDYIIGSGRWSCSMWRLPAS